MPRRKFRTPGLVTTGELAAMLGVARSTVIGWDNRKLLPDALLPVRKGVRQMRLWTIEQAEDIKKIVEETTGDER